MARRHLGRGRILHKGGQQPRRVCGLSLQQQLPLAARCGVPPAVRRQVIFTLPIERCKRYCIRAAGWPINQTVRWTACQIREVVWNCGNN